MQPTRSEAEALVARAVLGEIGPDAAPVRAALAAFPDLADELRELTAVRDGLAGFTDDARAVEAEARGDVRADDVAALRRLTGPPRRRQRWPLLLAALLAVGVAFAVWRRDGASRDRDGMLESTAGVTIDRSGATWTVDPGMQLPPGARYLVTLEIDGRPVLAPQSFPCPIPLPPAWQDLVDRAPAAQLLVELPELGWRRRVPLR